MDISTLLTGLHWAPLGSAKYVFFDVLCIFPVSRANPRVSEARSVPTLTGEDEAQMTESLASDLVKDGTNPTEHTGLGFLGVHFDAEKGFPDPCPHPRTFMFLDSRALCANQDAQSQTQALGGTCLQHPRQKRDLIHKQFNGCYINSSMLTSALPFHSPRLHCKASRRSVWSRAV